MLAVRLRQLVRLDRGVRADGPRPRAVRGADARGRAPPAVPQPQGQRLRRPLAARLPVVHADRRVPARPHGAPPRRVRARRARHPPLPRLPDLEATRCGASSSATRRASTGWKLFKGLLGAVRSDNAPVRFQARAIVGEQLVLIAIGIALAPPVGVLHPLARAVPHGLARHQPAAFDRRARRHAAVEGPPPHDAHRCGSRRSRASSSSRSTSAGTSRTTSTRASRWRTCPKLHAELRRAGYVTDGLEYRELHRRSGASSRAVQASPSDATDSTTSPSSCARRPRTAGCATTRSTTTPSSRCSTSPRTPPPAGRSAARSSSCATPTSATSSPAPTARAGRSTSASCARRSGDDALLEDRQWESDHFEDVPVLVVACLPGRRPLFPAVGAAAFYGAAFPAVQNLLLAAAARGLGASATTLPLWSVWEARRTLGLPRRVTPVSVVALGWPRGAARRPAAARRRPRRQRRPPRPLGPPALSRPARPRARADTA